MYMKSCFHIFGIAILFWHYLGHVYKVVGKINPRDIKIVNIYKRINDLIMVGHPTVSVFYISLKQDTVF